jgi:hypothetical protein
MKSKRKYRKNDRVLVKTFCGYNICVTLKKRYIANNSEYKLGVDGWEAQITNQKEVNKLRASGVPYEKGEKPIVFVADWEIIKKCATK